MRGIQEGRGGKGWLGFRQKETRTRLFTTLTGRPPHFSVLSLSLTLTKPNHPRQKQKEVGSFILKKGTDIRLQFMNPTDGCVEMVSA